MVDLELERLSRHMTQAGLAEKSGLSRSYISLLESGKRAPSVKAAKKLGVALGIQWTEFFD